MAMGWDVCRIGTATCGHQTPREVRLVLRLNRHWPSNTPTTKFAAAIWKPLDDGETALADAISATATDHPLSDTASTRTAP